MKMNKSHNTWFLDAPLIRFMKNQVSEPLNNTSSSPYNNVTYFILCNACSECTVALPLTVRRGQTRELHILYRRAFVCTVNHYALKPPQMWHPITFFSIQLYYMPCFSSFVCFFNAGFRNNIVELTIIMFQL